VSTRHQQAFQTYVGASLPSWGIAVIAAVLLHEIADVGGWIAAAVATLWIGTDLLMFPYKRKYYTSEPIEERMLGETAITVSTLDPSGHARIRGELWQAVSVDGTLPEGTRVRVRSLRGLVLVVERHGPPTQGVSQAAGHPGLR
jgi:membrane-bound ClpP family serine protease